jgi:hypothetical protein
MLNAGWDSSRKVAVLVVAVLEMEGPEEVGWVR